MNETAIANEAINFTSNIDFSLPKTSDPVSVFETTIRYLGGILSAYDITGRSNPVLLDKARQLADKMSYAWSDNQAIPYRFLDFRTNEPSKETSNIAEAGTLVIEWSTLSTFTGDTKYRDFTEKALRHIASLPAPLPGLPAQGIDPSSGDPVGGYVTWGGGSDSYFEYLIKYARLSNPDDPLFADAWYTAVDSSIRTLLKKSTVGNFSYLADYDDDKRIRHVSSHLACFHGGNWLFGGQLLNNQTIVDIGLDLIDACWNTYQSTATGIGPEGFAFKSDDGDFTGSSDPITSAQEFAYSQHGFYITSPDYVLRPEVLESNFYAWRVTGDTKYLDRASQALDSFKKYLKSNVGYGGIYNVNSTTPGKVDDTESFWFAETLKYLYLTFDDPLHISLDEWVFNTECHPVRAPPLTDVHSSGKLPTPTTHNRFKPKPAASLPSVSSVPLVLRYLRRSTSNKARSGFSATHN